jgi:hypothetical protein
VSETNAETIPFWTAEVRDTVERNDFRIVLSTSKFSITGIYVAKRLNGQWRGSIINEFGIKVCDVVSNAKKCELINVIPFLNKWYIRKVVASDIQFIMEIDNPNYKVGVVAERQWEQDILTVNYKKAKQLQRLPNGEIKYFNHKHGLTYSFIKISEN